MDDGPDSGRPKGPDRYLSFSGQAQDAPRFGTERAGCSVLGAREDSGEAAEWARTTMAKQQSNLLDHKSIWMGVLSFPDGTPRLKPHWTLHRGAAGKRRVAFEGDGHKRGPQISREAHSVRGGLHYMTDCMRRGEKGDEGRLCSAQGSSTTNALRDRFEHELERLSATNQGSPIKMSHLDMKGRGRCATLT